MKLVMRIGWIVAFILLSVTTKAQLRGQVSLCGLVTDSTTSQPLPQATVELHLIDDSSSVRFQLTDYKGQFVITNLLIGRYLLTISYIGYAPLAKRVNITLPTDSKINVGTLVLHSQAVRLNEVIVRRQTPVIFRHDTLEFNAGSFSTKPNAVVEDLLRKLPGVDVSPDGRIMVQGKTVQEVFVNGKPFFGTNPTMATRNLPAELIDKVQVFDRRSDQSSFSGVDDGSRTRTINITTKPEGRRGQFGQQAVGYGTNGRYQVGGGINRFRHQQQLSLLGQINNVNQTGYSLPVYGQQSTAGVGMTSSQGQVNGVTRATGAGLNYSDQLGKHTDVATSYQLSNAFTEERRQVRRQTVLPNKKTATGSDTVQSIINDISSSNATRLVNHLVSLRVTFRPDSLNELRWNSGFSAYATNFRIAAITQTFADNQAPLNQSLTDNQSVTGNQSWNSILLWTHRFHKPFRTFSLNVNTALNRQLVSGINQAQNIYSTLYVGSVNSLDSQINQQNAQQTRYTTNELTLRYIEPLAPQQLIEFRYNLYTNQSRSTRTVFDLDQLTNQSKINSDLSSRYQSAFVTQRFGSGWQIRQTHYRCTVGLDVQRASLWSDDKVGNFKINHQYVNLLPSAIFEPQLANNKTIQFQYQTRITPPSITQLQPVDNVTNPLFIQAGNPDLRPEYTHSITANYNQFHPVTYNNVFALLGVEITNHRIVTATTIQSDGIQTLQPVNVKGYAMINGSLSLSHPLQMGPLVGTLNLNTNLNLTRGVSFVNDQRNQSLILIAGQSARLNATLDSVELNISGTLNYRAASYSLQEAKQQSVGMMLTTHLSSPLLSRFRVATDITHVVTIGQAVGYNQQYTLWNGYISLSCFKQKGEWRIQVFDLLNQNRSLARTITSTFVEDVQSQVLKRYILLSFIYNLRQFGTRN